MKLRLLFIAACIVTGLHGAETSIKNESELQKALAKASFGNAVIIFCDHNKQLTAAECKNAMKEFRKGVNGLPVIDYVVCGQKMHDGANGDAWVQNSTNIETICKQSFYRTNNLRGRVFYATTPDDKKSVDTYIREIKSLKEAGWNVFVKAHDVQLAQELHKQDLDTTLVVKMTTSSTTFLGKSLFWGGVGLLIFLIYTNFDVLKSKFA